MDHNGFFNSLKAGELKPLYLFEGAEEYIKGQALARLLERLLPAGLEAMNLTELTNPDADTLIAAAETLPFLSDRRVVLARDSDLLTVGPKGDDEKLERMLAYLERQAPSTVIVFLVKGKADGRKKLCQALQKKNATVDFSPMGDAEAAGWAVRTLRALGKQMTPNCAQKLIFTVGRDAALLRQEMEKLAACAGERENVTEEDIDAVCVRTLECTVFQMVDAQVSGRGHDACRLMSGVLEGGEDRFMVLSMLLRQYRILYHMRSLMEERVKPAELPGLLGIPPFAVPRTQAQARRYSRERLKAAYDYLYELEYDLKSGRMPQEGCAEAALFTLDAILNGSPTPER
jgi:DNA polymerase III subunit delta